MTSLSQTNNSAAKSQPKNKKVGSKNQSKKDESVVVQDSLNGSLHAAKKAKEDEFYTRYGDIEKEIEAFLDFNPNTFRNQVVYCNCDDPYESNFFKYFATNFNKLGLKRLISTSYDGSTIANVQLSLPEYTSGQDKRKRPKATAVILEHVKDEDGTGVANIGNVKTFLERNEASRVPLKDDGEYLGGDFRNADCVKLLKEADIVVTNPPFSLFREYIAQLVEHEKKFLVIGNKNAITYKEIFPLIRNNKIWLGSHVGDMAFRVPSTYAPRETRYWVDEYGKKWRSLGNACWFTNLDHGKRHGMLSLMTMADNLKFSKHKEIKGKAAYSHYDNYEAIDVPFVDAIPSDYKGEMGVPITFLDKYNPDQFEIIRFRKGNDDKDLAINGKCPYFRIIVKGKFK